MFQTNPQILDYVKHMIMLLLFPGFFLFLFFTVTVKCIFFNSVHVGSIKQVYYSHVSSHSKFLMKLSHISCEYSAQTSPYIVYGTVTNVCAYTQRDDVERTFSDQKVIRINLHPHFRYCMNACVAYRDSFSLTRLGVPSFLC